MTRFRAAFALLFQLLLLQVSVLGGGMACAPDWLGAVAQERVADHGAAGHGGGASSGDHAGHGSPGAARAHAGHGSGVLVAAAPAGSPATHPASDAPSHCAAATGCAAIAVEAPEVVTAVVAALRAPVQVGPVSRPSSTRPAPEPPPPRA